MEEAQELTATNAGQPHIADLQPAADKEDSQEMTATMPTEVTAAIQPAEE